jgi:hypothetical protein
VGAYLDEGAQQQLMDDILKSAGIYSVMDCPVSVEVRKRVNTEGGEVFIMINHEQTEKQMTLPWLAREHLRRLDTRELQLEPYGVAVITRAEKDDNK